MGTLDSNLEGDAKFWNAHGHATWFDEALEEQGLLRVNGEHSLWFQVFQGLSELQRMDVTRTVSRVHGETRKLQPVLKLVEANLTLLVEWLGGAQKIET